jgi:hypothetical protein
MRNLNVVLTAAAAVTLSAAPLSAQWGIFGGRSSSEVPPGHMPSRGMCRVWVDGVPPGRQPRQTDCRTAERERRYYEQRYGRRARVIYGDRTHRNGTIYGDRSSNCRYVERVIAGRVLRQRVCDYNGRIYDRNGRIYDRDGRVYDRDGRVYDRDGRVYDRNGRRIHRRADRDSDSDKHGRGKHKNKNKGKGRWGN